LRFVIFLAASVRVRITKHIPNFEKFNKLIIKELEYCQKLALAQIQSKQAKY